LGGEKNVIVVSASGQEKKKRHADTRVCFYRERPTGNREKRRPKSNVFKHIKDIRHQTKGVAAAPKGNTTYGIGEKRPAVF